MATGHSTDDTFTFKIQLESSTSGELVNYEGDYYLTDDDGNYYHYVNGELISNGTTSVVCGSTDENGQVSGVPVDYTVSITGLLSGTNFKVVEINPNTGLETAIYDDPTYQIATESADNANTTNGASGTIKLGENALVTVTNSFKLQISVSKEWIGTQPASGTEIYVGLYQNEKPVENKTLLLNQSNSWTDKFEGLTGSGYTVKELRQVTTGETTDFNINSTGYIGITEGGLLTVNNGQYTVDYGDLTQDSTIKNQQNITIKNIQKWQIVKRSSSDNNLFLENAVFTLTEKKNDGDTKADVYKGKSDKDGVIKWKYSSIKDLEGVLPDGTYTMVETQAPTGYQLGGEWEITILNGIPTAVTGDQGDIDEKTDVIIGTVTFDNQNGILTLYYDNEVLYNLPSAGGPGIYWYTLSGTLLMAGAALIVYRQKRKREVLLRK